MSLPHFEKDPSVIYNETTLAPSVRTEAKYLSRQSSQALDQVDYRTTILLVCRQGSTEALESYVSDTPKPWYRRLMMKEDKHVEVTDQTRIQAAIHAVESRVECEKLIIIVSGSLERLHFHVGLSIRELRVFRCGFKDNAQQVLVLNGSSSFAQKSLQDWEGKKHKKRSLWLGPGVFISVKPSMSPSWRVALAREEFETPRTDEMNRHIEEMAGVPMEGSWWERWEGPMAAILGILAGSAKFVATVNFSAAGAFVQYKFTGGTVTAGMWWIKAAATASASTLGGAVLVGAGVAAAVYFIPWEDYFGWLQTTAHWLWRGLRKLWEMVKRWLKKCCSNVSQMFKSTSGHSKPSRVGSG